MDDERDHASPHEVIRAVSRLLDEGRIGVLVTILTGNATGSKILIDELGNVIGEWPDADLKQAAIERATLFLESRQETRAFKVGEFAPEHPAADLFLLFERIRPEPKIVICGAGHVGAALAFLASFVGYHVTLIDDREEFLQRQRFPQPSVDLLIAQDWTESVLQSIGDGKGVAVAVVTRGHNEDEECMRAVMQTNPDYIGLIGSKRRTKIVIDRLREAGASEEQLKKIHAPIGLDIGAVTPEEVALAIIAEMVCERRGGQGGPLTQTRR